MNKLTFTCISTGKGAEDRGWCRDMMLKILVTTLSIFSSIHGLVLVGLKFQGTDTKYRCI